jgi:hypothetical protein
MHRDGRVPVRGALLRKARYVTFSIDGATGRLISADNLNAIDEQNVVAFPVKRRSASLMW